MSNKAWEIVFDYVKALPFWPVIEPFVVIAVVWAAAQTLAYEWLSTSGSFKPSIGLFLGSYLSKRITIAALGLAAVVTIARYRHGAETQGARSRLGAYWQAHRRTLGFRAIAVTLVVGAVAAGFRVYSPNRVSHITVQFMNLEPQLSPEALAYLIYELNRLQRNWYFDVDFRPFTPEVLTSGEVERCSNDARSQLCHAEALAGGQPFIGVTAEPLGGAYFAEHRGPVSVISTFDHHAYEPLSIYEYLVYLLILQGMTIHFDVHGGGLPEGAFEERRVSHGGIFQFLPEKQMLKSSMLAARLSPDEEGLLLNTFGSEYVNTAATLLSMDWLYSDRVRGNLELAFGAKLGRVSRTPTTQIRNREEQTTQ